MCSPTQWSLAVGMQPRQERSRSPSLHHSPSQKPILRTCFGDGLWSTADLFPPGVRRSRDSPYESVLWRAQERVFVEKVSVSPLPDDPEHKQLGEAEGKLHECFAKGARYVGHMPPHENGFCCRTFVLPSSRNRRRDIREDLCDALGVSAQARRKAFLTRQPIDIVPDEFTVDGAIIDFDADMRPRNEAARVLSAFGDTYKLTFGTLGKRPRSGSVSCWISRSCGISRNPILGVIGVSGPLTPSSTPTSSPTSSLEVRAPTRGLRT